MSSRSCVRSANFADLTCSMNIFEILMFFDRAYSVTIPPSLTFTGTGSFPFFGAPIPGQLQVTLNSLTQLTFQETTTYGSCSNTYGGKLTKQ